MQGSNSQRLFLVFSNIILNIWNNPKSISIFKAKPSHGYCILSHFCHSFNFSLYFSPDIPKKIPGFLSGSCSKLTKKKIKMFWKHTPGSIPSANSSCKRINTDPGIMEGTDGNDAFTSIRRDKRYKILMWIHLNNFLTIKPGNKVTIYPDFQSTQVS